MLRRLSQQTKTCWLIACLCLGSTPAFAVNWQSSAIEGADANADGIRDDVMSFIQTRWSDVGMRFWATEAAKAGQAYLLSDGNAYALQRAHAFMERSRRCLTELKSPETANNVINQVLNKQLDTYNRQKAYKEAVSQWMYEVSREGLPSRPDADWTPACDVQPGLAPKFSPATEMVFSLPTDEATDNQGDRTQAQPTVNGSAEDAVPPPNFFITRAMPAEADEAESPSGSVKVKPLPVTKLSPRDSTINTTAAKRANTAAKSNKPGWQTYSPRKPNPAVLKNKPAQSTARANQLPVEKRAPGKAPIRTKATQPARSGIAAKPHTPQQAVTSVNQLPPALRELAPFIQSVEQR